MSKGASDGTEANAWVAGQPQMSNRLSHLAVNQNYGMGRRRRDTTAASKTCSPDYPGPVNSGSDTGGDTANNSDGPSKSCFGTVNQTVALQMAL